MRKYEILLILPAEADDKVVGGVTDRISQVLSQSGGEVVKVDRWGKRRLAFEINKHAEGIYAVLDVNADPDAVKELDRQLSLNESVLRTKVMRRETARTSA